MRRGAQHQDRVRPRRKTGIDSSENFVRHAKEEESREPRGIRYRRASAVELPFENASFDYATALMSLRGISESGRVLAEVCRVLRPGAFLQFSITHPCFDTPHRENPRDETGRTHAIEVGGYFDGPGGEVEERLFSGAPPAVRKELCILSVSPFSCEP